MPSLYAQCPEKRHPDLCIGKSDTAYKHVEKMEDRKTQLDWHDEVKIRSKSFKDTHSDKACAMQVWAPESE